MDVASLIHDSAARALWVTAYASFVEEIGEDEAEERGLDRAGGGEDWMDVAPETPAEADVAAENLIAAFLDMNRMDEIENLFATAMVADGEDGIDFDDTETAESFGHYLAMMAMGEGVSWFDDHKRFDLNVPRIESHFDGEFYSWSMGRTRVNPGHKRGRELYPCTVCGGQGPHEGTGGHAYTTAPRPGELMEYPCSLCGGRGRHEGPGHAYTTIPESNPRRNPVGDRVEAVSGPARGQRGVVRGETGRVAEVEFESGRRGHVERGALRTRGR